MLSVTKLLGATPLNFYRAFHASARLLMPDVVVPPLGESVSEGSISAVLKKAGDPIKVDEVVAQLETDKVTIDCKSPHAGTISDVLVKVGDVVKPGARLVVVGSGAAAPASHSVASSAAPTPQASASTSSSTPSSAGHAGRAPSIKFPPRVTPDGQRISSMPAAQADSVLAQILGASAHGHAAPPPPPAPAAPVVSAPAAAKPVASKPPTVAGPAKSQNTVWITERPARQGLTKTEMDMINLGGAIP